MRLAIVGSRDYPDLRRVADFVSRLPAGTVVVSGGARGPDRAAVQAAHVRRMETEVLRADWDHLGNRAGFERNELLVEKCDALVAFWDGASRGTAHAITVALRKRKKVRVCDSLGRQIEIDDLHPLLRRALKYQKPAAGDVDYEPSWEPDKVSTSRTRSLRRWAKTRTRR